MPKVTKFTTIKSGRLTPGICRVLVDTMKAHQVLIWLAFSGILQGCAPFAPYHPNIGAGAPGSINNKPEYHLAFIEFGEQGSYQDPTQLTRAVRLIESTKRPLVITYVHGWHNNANTSRGDVIRFQRFLGQLGGSPIIQRSGFKVIGVYLGWRGETITPSLLSWSSFYSRKTAAERLASNGDCYDAIASITEAARKSRSTSEQYTILVGHSFGGLVVERAVAHALLGEMHRVSSEPPVLPADLVILLNPASDSVLARQMVSAFYVRKLEGSREMIVSLTSRTDWATGSMFPLGTGLAAVTKHFDTVSVPADKPFSISEREFYTSTPGKNRYLRNYFTETLEQRPGQDVGPSAFEANLSSNIVGNSFWTSGKESPGPIWQHWKLARRGGVDVPYMNVEVDPAIIDGHGDVWNDNAQAMMAAIFRMNFPLVIKKAARQVAVEHGNAIPPARLSRPIAVPALRSKPDVRRLKSTQPQPP